MGGPQWVMGIKEGIGWGEHWVFSVSDESPILLLKPILYVN